MAALAARFRQAYTISDAPTDTAAEAPAGPPADAPADGHWREARFRHSPSFIEVLRQMRCTLLVSTYQAGKLISIGTDSAGLQFGLHEFDQAMGVAANPKTIAVGARGQIWFLADSSQIAARIEPAGRYDRCYLARSATVTGGIQCHELAWGRSDDGHPELWIVNTLFSSLVTLHPEYSFVPRWRPPFVSRLAGEDRCHLNGVGMRDGKPAFVTVAAQSDEPAGWRADKSNTGAVIDVASGQAVTSGLAMPHSPRWYGGRLLVLDSGRGSFETVDLASGRRAQIASVPGFARGLACHGNLAFVGLSRIRETAIFGGVPIAERHAELKCGIGVIDLNTGNTVAMLEFESGIEEIFDVQVVPETRCIALSGGRPGSGHTHEIWVVPPGEGPAGTAITPQDTVAMTPQDVVALVARAQIAQREGRAADAVAMLRQAAAARPQSPEIENHLGNALQESGDQPGALAAYQRAVDADARFGPAHQNLGYLLVAQGRTDEGIEHLRRAQQVKPLDINKLLIATALPVVYSSGADLAVRRRRLERDVQALADDGLRIDTTDTLVPTNFYAAYQGIDDRPLHANLGRIFQGVDAMSPTGTGSRSRDRIRVGFLSAYLRDHTIGRLNLGRVQHLDRRRFEVVVLSASVARDPIAVAFEQAADRYVRVPRAVADARRVIAEQDLDLLLFTDVGMDALTYTLAFSRMAPVQCATWGHPVTTGSPTIDHFISSELLEVPGADAHYTERLVRLPSLGTYYERPERPSTDGARGRLGLADQEHVYTCPQTLFKFHPDFDPLLAGILRSDPEGVLVLIEGRAPEWTQLLRERFARTMPDVVDRVRWIPGLPRDAFLQLVAVSDVLLDPTAFGGGNTTYEALAVDTPVVTLPGELMRTRITRALYARAGYEELVVDSPDTYVETAVRIATDPAFAQSVREEIAAASPVLFENGGEIRDLEEFLATATA